MRQSALAFKPVANYNHDYSGTNVTTGAWVEVIAATDKPCNAIEIFDSSGSILEIALGAAASEVALPYYILPGGSVLLLPFEIPKGSRVSLKALDADATAGFFILNTFG